MDGRRYPLVVVIVHHGLRRVGLLRVERPAPRLLVEGVVLGRAEPCVGWGCVHVRTGESLVRSGLGQDHGGRAQRHVCMPSTHVPARLVARFSTSCPSVERCASSRVMLVAHAVAVVAAAGPPSSILLLLLRHLMPHTAARRRNDHQPVTPRAPAVDRKARPTGGDVPGGLGVGLCFCVCLVSWGCRCPRWCMAWPRGRRVVAPQPMCKVSRSRPGAGRRSLASNRGCPTRAPCDPVQERRQGRAGRRGDQRPPQARRRVRSRISSLLTDSGRRPLGAVPRGATKQQQQAATRALPQPTIQRGAPGSISRLRASTYAGLTHGTSSRGRSSPSPRAVAAAELRGSVSVGLLPRRRRLAKRA